jgi:hypothetical protein
MAVKRWFLMIALMVSLLLVGCGAPAATGLPYLVTVTYTAAPPSPQSLLATPLAQFTDTPAPADTPTLELSATPSGPTPTDTLLPPLELPSEKPSAPALMAWTGEPTYPGDSQPGRLFRVDYDPSIWAQTGGDYGNVVLAHRQIDYCTITPLAGRGQSPDWKVQHDFRLIGSVPYDVNTVIAPPDVVKFVMYVGGDQILLTGFQVLFQDRQDQCLQDAETVLATLRSFAAQPTITPTFTPEASATP